MTSKIWILLVLLGLLGWIIWRGSEAGIEQKNRFPPGREEVMFWHFWGGADLEVVRDIVRRFNQSQDQFWVREVAMPGNNFQAKLFLSVAGGSPPDLVNQDDPILADWGAAGLIEPFETFVPGDELPVLQRELLPAARRLTQVDGQTWGLCNGLDLRALYCNRTALREAGWEIPRTRGELTKLMQAPRLEREPRETSTYPFLPSHRQIWSWAAAGGWDLASSDRLQAPELLDTIAWFRSYAERYGAGTIAAFQQADQSLPGKSFPLLPRDHRSLAGRYLLMVDGQWRVRDLERFAEARAQAGGPALEFEVVPLPGATGPSSSGWVNGNFFVVPRGARQKAGAWAFMKFWVGATQPAEAARACAAGGWIPVLPTVIRHPDYQAYLAAHPLMKPFVDMAASEHLQPFPGVRGAVRLKRLTEQAVYRLMSNPKLEMPDVLRGITETWQPAATGGDR